MECVFPFHLLLSIMQTQMHFQFQQMDIKYNVSETIKKTKNLGKQAVMHILFI